MWDQLCPGKDQPSKDAKLKMQQSVYMLAEWDHGADSLHDKQGIFPFTMDNSLSVSGLWQQGNFLREAIRTVYGPPITSGNGAMETVIMMGLALNAYRTNVDEMPLKARDTMIEATRMFVILMAKDWVGMSSTRMQQMVELMGKAVRKALRDAPSSAGPYKDTRQELDIGEVIELCFGDTRQLTVAAIDQDYCSQCSQMHADVGRVRFQHAITLEKEEIESLVNEMPLGEVLVNRLQKDCEPDGTKLCPNVTCGHRMVRGSAVYGEPPLRIWIDIGPSAGSMTNTEVFFHQTMLVVYGENFKRNVVMYDWKLTIWNVGDHFSIAWRDGFGLIWAWDGKGEKLRRRMAVDMGTVRAYAGTIVAVVLQLKSLEEVL